MKIALIRKKYLPGRGGAEKVAERFVTSFLQKGHEITVFSEVFNADEADNLHWVKVPRGTGLSKTSSFHRHVQNCLNKDNLRERFDIVYSLCRTFPVDIFRITEQLHVEWLPLGYSCLARFNPRHRSILKLEKRTFNPENTGLVIANSKLIKKQLIKHYKYPKDRIKVVYNGINHKLFYPASPEEKLEARKKLHITDRFVCMFAAGNFKIKGLGEAIKAISKVSPDVRRKITLLVVGGDKPQPFLKMAEKLGVTENLVFAGRQKNMREYFIASDLFLYPSHYETFGNVVLEACACGVPVVTTRQIGAAEVIKENSNGFLVSSPDRVNRLADIVSAYAKLPRDEHVRFAADAVESTKDFTWEKHIDGLERIFKDYCARKKKSNQK
ncbi:glycosyltransferase family 4 protein [Lentisphaerota bacterium ZTH]|nr:glycosyltransferase family 4 protein [Lentisphaerota bacterium]WET07195.1 glycosyltransferase family 4 protein [Lentisphaerota bacterium ZTH]